MRVLFISAFAPIPDTHAGGQRIFQMIAGLSRFHDITLLTFLDEESERPQLSHIARYCKEVIPVLRTRNPYVHDPWGIHSRWLEVEYNCPEMRERVREAAFSGKYDILQFEYLQMSMFTPEHSPIPMVMANLEVQSLALERKLRSMPSFSLERFKLYKNFLQVFHFELKHMQKFNRVIVMTEEDEAYLKRYIPSLPTVVNTMGVDCAFFHPRDEPEEINSLVYVAYFRHEPNIDAAFWMVNEIMPLVAQKIPDVKLYLVGGHPPEELKQSNNGINVEVTGWVPDIRPYLSRCAVFVAPIRLGAGMRGKMLEAWAMGRPVIGTNIATAGMRANHGDNLMIADNKIDFADSICQLLNDSGMRRRIGKAGLQTVQQYYDWEQLVLQQDKLYKELI